ncbi:Dihydrofolate reductase type 3 [Rubripirellula lacrimiformis]|uniref:Dihydrofolate reductase n=1 Tax=Rubripirellula lacrimiformis TaxID=1930273 RepID=A0A517N6V0_9BACT|nr:dihydrofolate reductase [Rubripirellula lacrimiformis]QDT02876.1 Dihydrofolate reductase type 3 [Rubripirellula lacrimiformis]
MDGKDGQDGDFAGNAVAGDPSGPVITAVVAMTPSGTIGLNGDMPWRLRADLQRFKRMTMGGALIMGRKTYDSIGRTLPGRRTIVVTRSSQWSAAGVDRASSPDEAIQMAVGQPIYVVGGAEIYRQLLPKCQEVWLTRVWSSVVGDTQLSIDLSDFRVLEQTRVPSSPRDEVPTEFIRLFR